MRLIITGFVPSAPGNHLRVDKAFLRKLLLHSPLLLPILVGVLLRLSAYPLAHLDRPELTSQWEYSTIALNIAAGKGYAYDWWYFGGTLTQPTAYMLPGEVMIHLAALYPFGDTVAGHTALFLEHVVLGGLFIYTMGKILFFLFGYSRAARLGVWLCAIYPGFIAASVSFGLTSAVLAFDSLFLWALLVTLSKIRNGERAWPSAFGVGLLAGILAMFRSESYLLIAATTLTVLWLYRRSARTVLRLAAIASIGALIVCTPWIIRNYIVFHKVIVTSVNGGFNFWRGHNQWAKGSPWYDNGQVVWTSPEMWHQIETAARDNSNIESVQDSYHWHAAFDWIRSHPATEVSNDLKKLVFFWGIDPHDRRAGLPYAALYGITVFSLIAGIVRLKKERAWKEPRIRDAVAIMALWFILYSAIVVAFFPLQRLQIILIGFYFPLVAYGADGIVATIAAKFFDRRTFLVRSASLGPKFSEQPQKHFL
jgi:hypothetical protein